MRNYLNYLTAICIFIISSNVASYGQDTNVIDQSFIDELNEAIREKGVSIVGAHDMLITEQIANAVGMRDAGLSFNVPTYGIAVRDSDDNLIDVFGSEIPHQLDGNTILIKGYKTPDGARLEYVGSAGFVNGTRQLTAPSGVKKAIDVIASSTNYIAEKLCADPARPTKITLNLSAGFELVFSATTGSQVEWNMPDVCARYAE